MDTATSACSGEPRRCKHDPNAQAIHSWGFRVYYAASCVLFSQTQEAAFVHSPLKNKGEGRESDPPPGTGPHSHDAPLMGGKLGCHGRAVPPAVGAASRKSLQDK